MATELILAVFWNFKGIRFGRPAPHVHLAEGGRCPSPKQMNTSGGGGEDGRALDAPARHQRHTQYLIRLGTCSTTSDCERDATFACNWKRPAYSWKLSADS